MNSMKDRKLVLANRTIGSFPPPPPPLPTPDINERGREGEI